MCAHLFLTEDEAGGSEQCEPLTVNPEMQLQHQDRISLPLKEKLVFVVFFMENEQQPLQNMYVKPSPQVAK